VNNCSLCSVSPSDKLWSERGFFGLICKKCDVPMIVLDEHREALTDDEQATVDSLQLKHFRFTKPRGIGMGSTGSHWHEHYI